MGERVKVRVRVRGVLGSWCHDVPRTVRLDPMVRGGYTGVRVRVRVKGYG